MTSCVTSSSHLQHQHLKARHHQNLLSLKYSTFVGRSRHPEELLDVFPFDGARPRLINDAQTKNLLLLRPAANSCVTTALV